MYERTKISDALVPGMPDDWDGGALPPDYVDKWGKLNVGAGGTCEGEFIVERTDNDEN